MSNFSENVDVTVSEGAECFLCETRIAPRAPAIFVEFNVPVPIVGSFRVHREMHVRCAEALHHMLGKRIREAKA